MCWGVPGRVVEVNDMLAKVDVGGTVVDAVISVDDVNVGDYVVVHAGAVIGKLSEEEFVSNLAALAELQLVNYIDEGLSEAEARERVLSDLRKVLSGMGLDLSKYVNVLSGITGSGEFADAGEVAEVSVPKVAYVQRYRTSLSDTDYLQAVHYTNYFRYCERVWMELLNSIGFSYTTLIHKYGVFLPTVEVGGKVLSPTRMDNDIEVYAWVEDIGVKQIRWRCVIKNLTSNRVVADIYHIVKCSDTALTQSVELPRELVERLSKYLTTPK